MARLLLRCVVLGLAAIAFVACPSGASPYSDMIVTDGAAGYWRLDEANGAATGANSGSGGAALNAAYLPSKVDAAGLLATEASNTAADLIGPSRYAQGSGINTAGPGGTNVFANDWTIEAWLERDAVVQWSGVFSNNKGATSAPLMTFIDATDQLGINGAGVTANNVSVNLGQLTGPQHYLAKPVYAVITKTGGNAAGANTITVTANVDGVWLPPATGSTTWALNPADGYYIGRHYDGGPQVHDGTIDEVAIYPSALSTAQVQAHYNAGALSGYAAQVAADGPVGYWRLGEPAGSSTAANLGTAMAALNGTYSPAKVSAPGLIASDPDTAADFNGSTTQVAGTGISTAAPGGTSVFAGDWTIEAWLERDTVADWQGVFSNNNGASNAPLMTFIAGYTGEPHNLGINGSGSTSNNVSVDLSQFGGPGDPTAYLGKPVYAVITKTGGDAAGTNTIAVYANVDGTWLSPATGSTTWNLNAGADGYYIGRHYSGATQILNGRIDEVAIYSKALTPGDVHSHYGSGSLAAPEGYMTAVMNDGPVGYWRLGEAAASTKALNYGSGGAALNGTYSPAKAAAPGLIVWSNDTAADFNGSTTHVAGSNVAATGVFDNEWTIEAWFKRDTVGQWAGIFSNNGTNAATGSAPMMTFIDTTNQLGMNNAGVSPTNISIDLGQFGDSSTDYLGESVYAVITKTGSNAAGLNTIMVYANVAGEWLTPVTGSTNWTLTPRDVFSIGRHWQSGNYFDGTIDEVAIYSHALTGEQVREHYYAAVPEPATLVLLAGGCLALVRRRRKR